jgi:hypothetical protein
MPEFGADRLNNQGLNDLVTYLGTLRAPGTTATPQR